jgi:hypothetical protein
MAVNAPSSWYEVQVKGAELVAARAQTLACRHPNSHETHRQSAKMAPNQDSMHT